MFLVQLAVTPMVISLSPKLANLPHRHSVEEGKACGHDDEECLPLQEKRPMAKRILRNPMRPKQRERPKKIEGRALPPRHARPIPGEMSGRLELSEQRDTECRGKGGERKNQRCIHGVLPAPTVAGTPVRSP